MLIGRSLHVPLDALMCILCAGKNRMHSFTARNRRLSKAWPMVSQSTNLANFDNKVKLLIVHDSLSYSHGLKFKITGF